MTDQADGPASDAMAVARLAALTPGDYDRVRRQEADRLGWRADTLDAAVAKARRVATSCSEEVADRPPEFTDEALALRFTEQHKESLRYVASWGRWLIWDGRVWQFDDTLQAFDLSRAICRKASSECNEERVAAAIASAKTVAAVERLAKADRRHAAVAGQWDADPWLLNTPDGVVDLRTGKMRDHRLNDYMTKITAVSPAEECPLWRRFLTRITGGDDELQSFLQRFAGYSLTGITREHAMVFGYGTGANGKGTFLNTLSGLLAGYAAVAPMDAFTASPTDRHATELAMLRGARLVTAQETEEGRRWAEARIKALTGGDPITARFMRQDFFTYQPQFKLFVAGNHKPGLRRVDEAIRRRLNLVPFTVTIPAAERDAGLSEKLKAEWSGILRWMIDGCLEWQAQGLAPPAAVLVATDNYLQAEDAISNWIRERCKSIEYGGTESSRLFADWCAWSKAAGEDPGSQKRFSQALEDKGYAKDPKARHATFLGIALDVLPPRTEPFDERA
jgi:putative DNA primase/helicase